MREAWKFWGNITGISIVGIGTILQNNQILAQEAHVFRTTIQSLKKVTDIPIRLPSQLPISLTQQRLYLRSQGNTNSYSIVLESHPQCAGTNACYVGSFSAKREGKGIMDGERVSLSNGITASYRPLSCGASCTPPSIEWGQNGVTYIIQMRVTRDKTEAKREMIQLANLSISGNTLSITREPQQLKEKADRHYADNEYPQAIAAYTQAIELSPRYAALYYNRGLAYWGAGNRQTALENLRKAAQLYKEQRKHTDYQETVSMISTIESSQ
jgi:tetratricopeptide (TPR) repeat protein